MPFFTVNLWPGLSPELKRKWVYETTRITTELLNIPPDKIQVVFYDLPKENWGKAGAVPTDTDFAQKSRIVEWSTQDSYNNGNSISNMAAITVDSWNLFNQQQKDEWAKLITSLTVNLFDVPPDKVLFLIRDMPPGNWSQAGITGANSEYLNLSRTISFHQ